MVTEQFFDKEDLENFVLSKAYIFHITSLSNFLKIVDFGHLVARDTLTVNKTMDISNSDLILKRSNFVLNSGVSVTQAVPFYFNPRQPMFNRLIIENKVLPNNLIAICLNGAKICEYQNYLFTSNPVYDNSYFLGTWNHRENLNWIVLASWNWRQTNLHKIQRQELAEVRQAELLVYAQIPIEKIDFIITDSIINNNIIKKFNNIIINGIFSDILHK